MELKLLNLIFTWKGTCLPNKRYSRSSLVIQIQRRVLTQSRNYPQFRHPKFQYHVQNTQPPTPVLSEINPVHGLQCYLISTLIVSHHLRLGLPSGHFPLRFPRQNLTCISLSSQTCPMSCQSYHDRHEILFRRGVSHQASHYTVLVSDHNKIRKVPL